MSLNHRATVQTTSSKRVNPLAVATLVSLVLLLLTLVPLLAISPYNHSFADDWHYGVEAHLALERGEGIPGAVSAALRQMGHSYVSWQGTYSAILIMSLEPGVFSEQLYGITGPFILISLVAATFFFCHVLIRDYLHGPRASWLVVAASVCTVQILLQPSTVEGIFWFNSASYYSLYHALMLVMFGLLLRAINPVPLVQARSRKASAVGACLIAVVVAGGNFVTALVSLELAMLLCLYLARRRSARVRLVLPTAVTLAVGFAISMMAPGNVARQQTQFPDAGAGVVGTIGGSLGAGLYSLQSWTSGVLLLALIFCVPALLRALQSRHCPKLWRFSHPLGLTVASMALLASSFTPTFWSMGNVGPGRVQNIRFDLFVLLVFINLCWWCGWILRLKARSEEHPRLLPQAAEGPIMAVAALMLVALIAGMASDTSLREQLSSVSAARSLITGQAQRYDKQVQARLDYLATTELDELELSFYTDAPKVLFMGDIRDNMDNYINYRLAQWYGKKRIIGVRAPQGNWEPTPKPVTSAD